MKVAIELSADQLKLIADLVAWEKCQISGDIEEEEDSELSSASRSVLSVRFWQLEAIQQILISNKTTSTTAN